MERSKDEAWHTLLQLLSYLNKNNPKPYQAAKLDKWFLVEVETLAEELDRNGHYRVQFFGIGVFD